MNVLIKSHLTNRLRGKICIILCVSFIQSFPPRNLVKHHFWLLVKVNFGEIIIWIVKWIKCTTLSNVTDTSPLRPWYNKSPVVGEGEVLLHDLVVEYQFCLSWKWMKTMVFLMSLVWWLLGWNLYHQNSYFLVPQTHTGDSPSIPPHLESMITNTGPC